MASLQHILSSLRTGPTRRNLFGPVDHELLQQMYQNALRRDLVDATQRWGFDFQSEQPLSGGDFQWEVVSGTKVPLLYRPCMVGQNQGKEQKKSLCVAQSSRGKENIPSSPKKHRAMNVQNLEKTPVKREKNKLKRKQTNITDFYAAKRKAVGDGKNKLKRKQTNITDFYAAERKAVGLPLRSRQ